MHSEKVNALRANRTEKVGALRANKHKKGGFTAAHTRTALIWEYPLRGLVVKHLFRVSMSVTWLQTLAYVISC